MATLSPLIEALVAALQTLPGVGRKTATRMALFLLQGHRDEATNISESLATAIDAVKNCKVCRNLSDSPVCELCNNPKRQNGQLCVVASASDLIAVEDTGSFNGRYFVLGGLLSPIDGIGPKELGLEEFLPLVHRTKVVEVILALNATVEGETTAHFIQELLDNSKLRITQLAHGIPVGGELDYVNARTIAQAFERRVRVQGDPKQ